MGLQPAHARSLAEGTAGLTSLGPLTFRPYRILFLSYNLGAEIFAVAIKGGVSSAHSPIQLEHLPTRLAALFRCVDGDVVTPDRRAHSISKSA